MALNDVHSRGTRTGAMRHSLAGAQSAPDSPPARLDLTFPVDGERCAAWFYPRPEPGRAPCVVLAHGFIGVREQALDRYAERFAQRGMAVLVFDYRHFGDSGGEPRQLMSNRRQLEDYRAAVEFVRGRDDVDPERIALWGTSNSAGHVLKLAAADPRIRAVVVQSPFISGFAKLFSLAPTHGVRLLAAGARDGLHALLRLPPVRIKAVGQPYTRAVTTTPDALSGLARITPAETTWENAVLARFALTATFYSATRAGRRVRCPLLVCVADGDAVIPLRPALALAAPAGRTLRRYDTGHFGMYYGAHFDEAARHQADFLREHLEPAPLRQVKQ